ncbi:TonB-dependent siderophore receptor [Aquabacterium soli]|uniref:TonB-dependent siderophore receptor n=1 Tax=Aquabacterium soli TaxID=2493092 RepID=A0A426V8S3_9BURK|nr:TonB-dependent siderophore receptor [Aquabacterium soli]RRS03337.1 TonB-dependent siderophore receptor [Aquabacterium soli]
MQQSSFLSRLNPVAMAVLACAAALPSWAQEAAALAASAGGSSESLPEVRVLASREKPEGDAGRGYRSSTASQVGALGAKSLQDTPFSINVISRELIENVQATKPDDVIKINPVIQLNNPQSRFFSGVTMRGFSVGSNKRIDGQPNANMISVDMEDKERVEVLTGLSGFLYGPGNVGGTLNYVLKRPSADRFNRVTVGIAEGSSAYVHGDFNVPIDEQGRVAARLNVVAQDGGTATDHQSISRQLVSGAVDWNISQRLKVQFDASYSHYRMDGTNPYWSVASSAVKYPGAPDVGSYWGQPFTYTETNQAHAAARLQWDVSEVLGIRAGVARRKSDSALGAVNNTFSSSRGAYTVQISNWEYPDITNQAMYALADVRFNTGSVRHKVTAGFFGDIDERTNYRSSSGTGGWGTAISGAFNLSSPIYLTTRPLPVAGAKYVAARTHNSNLVVGNDIEFGDRWSALLGLTQSTIYDKAFGATTSVYDETRVTPSASLLFKPVPNVTVYGSYIESMEKGGTAAKTYSGQPVTNPDEIKPPLESQQIELGVKATVGGALLTAAVFQIDKGLQYYERAGNTGPYTFVQDGRQVHTGVELTSTGRVLPGLTVVGGVTIMNAEVTRNRQTPALEGKTPANVAEKFAKVYAEYDLPAVAGLTLTGGLYYTGKQSVDPLNTDGIPDFTTADIGARYKTKLINLPLTLRLNINNVTNKSYWLTANSTGAPRSLAISGQIEF